MRKKAGEWRLVLCAKKSWGVETGNEVIISRVSFGGEIELLARGICDPGTRYRFRSGTNGLNKYLERHTVYM